MPKLMESYIETVESFGLCRTRHRLRRMRFGLTKKEVLDIVFSRYFGTAQTKEIAHNRQAGRKRERCGILSLVLS
jgi:hypothetical protein